MLNGVMHKHQPHLSRNSGHMAQNSYISSVHICMRLLYTRLFQRIKTYTKFGISFLIEKKNDLEYGLNLFNTILW